MNIFISGATGYIGSRLAVALALEGHLVHALYRSENKTRGLQHPNIRLFKGDILEKESLEKAMENCSQVYHVAAFANIWEKDNSIIYRLNIEGTMNVIQSAIKSKAGRIVCTSTAGVMGPSDNDPLDETSPPPSFYFLDYERSKAILENILKTISLTGPDIIIVNPTRVYGPGLLSESNGVTRMIDSYILGKWHFIPGNGKSKGNYVYIDDVVRGHILAMDKGRNGERYLLGGENVSYNDFFQSLKELTGKKYFLLKLPLFIMLFFARMVMIKTYIFGTKPLITPALVRKFNYNFNISSSKAISELGYAPVKLREGLRKTIEWLSLNK